MFSEQHVQVNTVCDHLIHLDIVIDKYRVRMQVCTMFVEMVRNIRCICAYVTYLSPQSTCDALGEIEYVNLGSKFMHF